MMALTVGLVVLLAGLVFGLAVLAGWATVECIRRNGNDLDVQTLVLANSMNDNV